MVREHAVSMVPSFLGASSDSKGMIPTQILSSPNSHENWTRGKGPMKGAAADPVGAEDRSENSSHSTLFSQPTLFSQSILLGQPTDGRRTPAVLAGLTNELLNADRQVIEQNTTDGRGHNRFRSSFTETGDYCFVPIRF